MFGLNWSERGNQRERDRERAQARAGGKAKQPKGDGLTPEQRRERYLSLSNFDNSLFSVCFDVIFAPSFFFFSFFFISWNYLKEQIFRFFFFNIKNNFLLRRICWKK